MTFGDFEELYATMVAEEEDIATTKGREYVEGTDRLDNFKRIGRQFNIEPEVVLGVYMQKHFDAINSYIREGKTFSESIESRIMDARVYLALLRGLIKDKREAENV